MKNVKRMIASLLALSVCCVLTACGESNAPATTTAATTATTTVATEVSVEDTTVEEETTEDVTEDTAETSDFTLLDLTADMISTAVYAQDSNDNSEIVFTLFTAPSGANMCSLFVYNEDGSGDVLCGEYTGESVTDALGMQWTYMTFADVYTGSTVELGIAEGEDGSCYITNPGGSEYQATYLTTDDAITYMAVAANLIS